jgi:hypothetical protein
LATTSTRLDRRDFILKRKVLSLVPAHLGYGSNGRGSIPGGAVLILISTNQSGSLTVIIKCCLNL